MNDLVSIIIPSYGGGEFLQRTVDSILKQTYENIEAIVVDDNGIGTENQKKTAEQMKKYEGDPRVKYVCHEVNKNGSAARNTGVRNAAGQYLAFLDDDDIFYPENIETQINVLKSLPQEYAFTYCSRDEYMDGKKVREYRNTRSGFLFYEIMRHWVTIGSPAFLIRRNVYEEVGGFDESFRRHQDWEFVAKVAFRYKIKAIDKVGFRKNIELRNRHTDAATAKKYREHYLEKMMPYIKELPEKKKKDIIIYNRLEVAFEFFRYGGIKAFIKEYLWIKPGYRGIKFIYGKIKLTAKRYFNGEKIRR